MILWPIPCRNAVCEKVLHSRWKEELLMRHTGSALPAPFWHTTLLRYGAAYLPAQLRQCFLARQTLDYGKVEGELMLTEVTTTGQPVILCRINRAIKISSFTQEIRCLWQKKISPSSPLTL